MKKQISINDQIRACKTTKQVEEILNTAKTFEDVKPKTKSKWRRVATAKIQELNTPAPAAVKVTPAVKKK